MAAAGGKKSTYVDDVFSTNVYGPDSNAQGARTITTNIDYTEGALIWTKSRGTTRQHMLVDTVRGVSKQIYSDSHVAETTASTPSWAINTLTETGYNIGTGSDYRDANYYGNNELYASWNFRKAEGFFDIVTWTGNATNSSSPSRQIAHNLGSVPGAIWVKCLTANQSWACYHRGIGATRYMHLSDNGAGGTSQAWWNNTEPTSTHFTLWYDGQVNENGHEYVAYVFAGGASDEPGAARSVDFDSGQEDALTTDHSSDFDFGSGDFTVECWIKPTNASQVDPTPVSVWNFPDGRRSWAIFGNTGGSAVAFDGSIRAAVSPDGQFATRTEITGKANLHQWNHVAFTRSGNTLDLFINGVSQGATSFTGSVYSNTSDGIMIGGMGDPVDIRNEWDGGICNVRVVKGTAVYTSSFKPPTTGLTDITNTKLLCCNKNTVTGSTVTPGAITAHNSPTVSTDTPFDDPAGFKFGEGGDQNIIKCGSYTGTGTDTPPTNVFVGFEPQWIIFKNTNTSNDWRMFDCIRGIVTTGNDARFNANDTSGEVTTNNKLDITSTGFTCEESSPDLNGNGNTIIYIAIRRSDGYVGKPPELGTDVFHMIGASSTNAPPWYKPTDFPVDFAFARNFATTENWSTGSRLTGKSKLSLNLADAASDNVYIGGWDYNTGWNSYNGSESNYQAWMWKRGVGFDVLTYIGNGVAGRPIPHSLNRAPEMVWIKLIDRDNHGWVVGHIGLNGGTNPWTRYLELDTSAAEATQDWPFNDTAPTANHLILGNGGRSNGDQDEFIAMLFASVEGISKCGYYDGSASAQTITTGFQPRFLLIKRITSGAGGDDWVVADSVRGLTSGNDEILYINLNDAQSTQNLVGVTSTGFTVVADYHEVNHEDHKYIYYAHA